MINFESRIQSIQEFQGMGEASLITSDISVTYLTGYEHSEGYVFITNNSSYFLVDFRYFESAEKSVNHMNVVMFQNPYAKINELIEQHCVNSILIENNTVTLSRYSALSEKLNAEIKSDSKLAERLKTLRIIKNELEIQKLKKAQEISEKAFNEVLAFVKVGVTEKEIAARLEYLMKLSGASRVAFELITVTGKKTSLPHGVPSDNKVQNGDFVTFDIGAVYEGYHSDMTRTVAVGSVTDEQRKIYDIVLKAHLEAIDVVKAGVSGSYVDKVARDIITNEGYGEYFGHSTGHGVGLEIHESPFASVNSNDILEAGMTVTVEPGIYLPDKFGVRIEDTVLVTEDGSVSFATIPKELIIL